MASEISIVLCKVWGGVLQLKNMVADAKYINKAM